MLTKIAFVAPPGQAQKKIRTLLARPLSYLVREFQNMDEVHQGLSQFNFQVLISRVPAFDAGHVQMVARLRAAYPSAGLVTVSPQIDPRARYGLTQISRHTLVDEDLELDDFYRVIQRASEPAVSHAPRLHPRVRREDNVILIAESEDGSEVRLRARFLDFARMGARLAIESGEGEGVLDFSRLRLKAKSRMELRYRSSEDAERIHRIESRVVWATVSSNPVTQLLKKQKAEIGLRFVAEL